MPCKDLCLFPDIKLPVGFKMPKFDLYDECRDLVAHLKGYCSKMKSVCGKDKFLMAYFSESLSGEALEWYTHQDVSKWHAWGDMTQDFVRHYQYNVHIILDRFSLSQKEKKSEGSFGEFWLRWNEQVACNSLSAYDDAHFVGMMRGDMENENPLGNLPTEIGEDRGDSDEKICG
uniref:Uncharacterized protein LOC104218236 n=1 Tax=Nicotiana sylvestris TaxID=4096 RepID=A0A1U7VYA6_NICSY|nr:PREDICTED: uncharacterized protein LOC104218236 [Nicotiana sylvestris]